MKKKFYLLLIALSFSILASAQMPFAWWATLPADYQTNPYERMELQVKQVVDDDILNADGVEQVWNTLEPFFIFDVNNQTSGYPEQSPSDYTGECALLAGADNLYVIFNITDDAKDEVNDKVEIVFSPQVDPKDIDPTSLLPDSTTAPWVWDAETHDYHLGDAHFSVEDVNDMARYGLWSDDGDMKVGGISVTTNTELYAGTMYFKDNYIGTDTARLWITPDFGATSAPLTVVEEDRTGGYFLLVAIPWAVMNDNALENEGDKMSIAVQFADNTDDADSTYVYWGGTTDNSAYWGIRHYGAIAELINTSSIQSNVVNSNINVFYSNGTLQILDNVNSVDVFNLSGVKMLSVNNPHGTIELTSLPKGVYLAKVRATNERVKVVKFIK